MIRKIIGIGLFLLSMTACQAEAAPLRMATTTSTQDSGLMDEILPKFEEAYEIKVEVIAVGTGEALKLGESGDVDLVLVHARSKEDEFVANGFGVNRQDVMYNDFVLLGPVDDPANITTLDDAAKALQQIAEVEALFVSRGDESGTHLREMGLWSEVGIVEPEGDWYQSVGQGMGSALTIAEQQQAYIISDRGTYLKRMSEGLDLVVLLEGDARLLNPYGIIAVNPELHEGIEAEAADQFIQWITSSETQTMIDAYRINGEQLFFSNAN